MIETTGGGRVFVEMSDPYLDEPRTARAWRAISAYMDGGVRPIIVPFCDARHQPDDGFTTVPHDDGTSFDDDTEYSQGSSDVTVTVDAPLRATRLYMNVTALDALLEGGEWFTIDHPVMRCRAYRISEIITQSDDLVLLDFRPPLREAVTAGASVDFDDPRCVMKLSGEMRSPMSMGYAEGSVIRFVEDLSGAYA